MKHEVKVMRLGEIAKHPDADTLGVTEIDGYTVVVRLGEWSTGDLGVYVEPDYVVPLAPWSAFLGETESKRRIRVKRLRGIYSQGLLLQLRDVHLEGASEGDDVMEALGIVRWEPPEPGIPGACGFRDPGETPHPSLACLPRYDLDSWQKYGRLIDPNDTVYITEKLHGRNIRFAWRDDRMWVGSRNRWVPPDEGGPHRHTLACNPWIEHWCKANPDLVLLGESIGNMPKMRYGVALCRLGFVAFDVYDTSAGGFLCFEAFVESALGIPRAPVLYFGPMGGVDPKVLAEGKSILADHIREGVVVKPVVERFDHRIGRVALKCVGNGYLEKS